MITRPLSSKSGIEVEELVAEGDTIQLHKKHNFHSSIAQRGWQNEIPQYLVWLPQIPFVIYLGDNDHHIQS
jgi:hypothetical protein